MNGADVCSYLSEHRISLRALAQQENVDVSTCWRWTSRGVRGVKLESFSVGGKTFTTSESFARFVAATTAARRGDEVTQHASLRGRRAAAYHRAKASLEREGF